MGERGEEVILSTHCQIEYHVDCLLACVVNKIGPQVVKVLRVESL